MPASEPAAAARTWFSSHSKVSAPTISKLWSLVAFIVAINVVTRLASFAQRNYVDRQLFVSKPMALLSVMELPIGTGLCRPRLSVVGRTTPLIDRD